MRWRISSFVDLVQFPFQDVHLESEHNLLICMAQISTRPYYYKTADISRWLVSRNSSSPYPPSYINVINDVQNLPTHFISPNSESYPYLFLNIFLHLRVIIFVIFFSFFFYNQALKLFSSNDKKLFFSNLSRIEWIIHHGNLNIPTKYLILLAITFNPRPAIYSPHVR